MRTAQNDHGDRTAARSGVIHGGRHLRAVIYLRVSTERQARSGGEPEATRSQPSATAWHSQGRVPRSPGGRRVRRHRSQRQDRRPRRTPVHVLARLERAAGHRLRDRSQDRPARTEPARRRPDHGGDRAEQARRSCRAPRTSTSRPKGRLMHGIMASMAEFYSSNLATEAKKGLHKKAARGRHPRSCAHRLPEHHQTIEGEQKPSIGIDPERGPHPLGVQVPAQPATGQFRVDQRVGTTGTAFETGAALRRQAPQPKPGTAFLSSRYYIGMVTYGGVTYQGTTSRSSTTRPSNRSKTSQRPQRSLVIGPGSASSTSGRRSLRPLRRTPRVRTQHRARWHLRHFFCRVATASAQPVTCPTSAHWGVGSGRDRMGQGHLHRRRI